MAERVKMRPNNIPKPLKSGFIENELNNFLWWNFLYGLVSLYSLKFSFHSWITDSPTVVVHIKI